MFAPDLPTDILQAESNSPELTSWDFLQDVDFGLEPELGGSSQPQVSAKGTVSNSERLKEKNRKAQKRFRERKKERAHTTEAQLAETTSQLHDLRLKQRELEARNSLLEKIAALNKQSTFLDGSRGSANAQSNSASSRQVNERDFFLQILEQAGLRRTQQGSAIVLTGRDCEEEVTIAYLTSLHRDELIQLKTVYMQKMAQCLLDVSDNSESQSLIDLQRYSLEMTATFACCWMTNAHRAAAAVIESLSIQGNPCGLEGLSDNQYEDLLVAMKLTEAQEQDLLHLRRLFYGKLGQLARERAALLQQMPSPAQPNEAVSFHRGFRNVADQLAQTKEVSDQLCANHAAESSVYQIHGFCMFRCIYSTVQHATMMVHSYPRPVDPNKLLEMVASKHNEPSTEALLSPSGVDDLQHSANWETVREYMSTLSPSNVHDHCPFLQQDGDPKS